MRWEKKTDLDSSQQYAMTGQEQWAHIEIQKILPEHKRTLTVKVIKHWNRLPKEAVGLHPQRHSKFD